MKYKLLGRTEHRRQDEIISPGDVFEPTEAELQAFPDKLEKVESEEPADESDAESDPECGYNGCGRSVSDPDARCWQHEDE